MLDMVRRRQKERAKESQLIEQQRARQAAIARGEKDPLDGQPEDGTSWLMVDLQGDEFDEKTRGKQIFCMNSFLAAKAIIYRTHAIASREEIEASTKRDHAAHAQHVHRDDISNNRRTVRVEPLAPTGGKK